MNKKRILIACEFSGVVRDAFTRAGWDAWSCDLLPSEKPGNHYLGDVRHIINEGWDMMIAHPPCTYLCNSGVSWLSKKPGRWEKLIDAANFFRGISSASIPRICVENPIMHGHAKKLIGIEQPQTIQPWMFGHTESKATCLWLKNLPPLIPTKIVKTEMMKLPVSQRQRLHYLPPGPQRAKIRSMTYPGIAEAMAAQWGVL